MIILPDIHGRDFWRKPVEENLGKEHILFLGDYLDPYDYEGIYPSEAYEVFVEIVDLKKEHPGDVTLLLGNHDLHYLDEGLAGGRKDHIRAVHIRKMFEDNANLFDMAMNVNSGDKRFLFTHAGVKRGWMSFNKELFSGVSPDDIGDYLNALWHVMSRRPRLMNALAQVSYSRWGRHAYGSPVWNDIDDMDDGFKEIPGWYQIFGHSQQENDPVIRDHFACLDCRRPFRLNETIGAIEKL